MTRLAARIAQLPAVVLRAALRFVGLVFVGFDRGLVAFHSEDYRGAIAHYTRALEGRRLSRRRRLRAHQNRGAALLQLGRHEAAVADFDAALAIAPDDADALSNRGLAHSRLGNLDAAVRDFGRALELNPKDANALHMRGDVHFRARDMDRALADYDRALALGYTAFAMLHNRAAALTELERYPEARAQFDAALRIDPDDPETIGNRGLLHLLTGRPREALADFDRSLRLQPDQPGFLFHRGQARFFEGDRSGAAADFADATARRPLDDEFALWLHVARSLTGADGREALSTLAEYLGDAWPAPIVHMFLGRASVVDVLDAAAVANPGSTRPEAEASLFLGYDALLHGDPAEADRFFRRCLEHARPASTFALAARAELARLERSG